MSNLSSFFGAKQSFVQDDPMNQVAFGIYSRGYNAQPAVGLYNHRLEYIGKTALHTGNTGAWQEYVTTEFSYGIGTTSALVTTGANNPYINGGPSAQHNSAVGHMAYKCPTNPRDNSGYIQAAYKQSTSGVAFSVLPGATLGLDQHYMLYTRDYNGMYGPKAGFYIRRNSGMSGAQIARDQNTAQYDSDSGSFDFHDNASYANRVELQQSGFATSGANWVVSVGGITYNQRTKTLCILERDAADNNASWRPVICKNAPDPVDYIENENGYQVALAAAIAVSGNRIVGPQASATNWNAFQFYNARPMLCDDGTIYWYQEPSNANPSVMAVIKWTMNAGQTAFNAQDAASVHANANSWSVPNYHSATAAWGGASQYQQSLDGETVMCYSAPYYYQGAFRYILINLKTGKATKLETAQDTANAWQCSAYGARNFFITQHSNTDGYGLVFTTVSWESYDRMNGGAGNYTGTENTKLINSLSVNMVDNPFYSTDYPALWRNVDYDNRAIVLASKNQYNPGASQ